MKKAIVNGHEIGEDAVNFEFDRLVRFYTTHGMTVEEVKRNLAKLREKALDQAIGARLLFDRANQLDLPVTAEEVDAEVARVISQIGGEENYRKALAAQGITEEAFRKDLEKGARVNKLVNQACAHIDDPTESEVASFYEAHKAEFTTPDQGSAKTLVDVHDQIKDLLRHNARGLAIDAFVADLRANAKIEFKEAEEHHCSCGHHHDEGHTCTCGHSH